MATLRYEPARVCAYCALHSVKPNPVYAICIVLSVFVFDFIYALLCGAGDGIRTRDFHLGKVTLYH